LKYLISEEHHFELHQVCQGNPFPPKVWSPFLCSHVFFADKLSKIHDGGALCPSSVLPELLA
jgi:hypothetical protein